MNQLPNIISVSRAIAAIGLLFSPVFSVQFWVLYGWCGVSDMIDGPLARKLGAESRTGAVIDSISDLVFVVAAAIRVLPVLDIPVWLWIWIAAIALTRIGNILLGYFRQHRIVMLHTMANKLTGLLLFLLPAAILTSGTSLFIAAVCAVATFASVQEGIKIQKG